VEKNCSMTTVAKERPNKSRAVWPKVARSMLAALGLAVALSGCVIEPWHPDHPHYHGY